MTDSERRSPSLRRAVRGMALALSVVAIASTALAAMRWEVVWGAAPGRVGAPSVTIALDTPPDSSKPAARLAVLGDVGTGDANEWATAGLVTDAASRNPIDALVLLGDNVYPDGDPDRLGATVFGPFGKILEKGTALLPVLGNHDVENAPGQIAALDMPGRWYATEIGPTLIIGLDSNLVDDRDQLRWLESTLAGNESPWVIVTMHHPAYSAGYHGSTEDIQKRWVPVFERYGVDLVLAGHDHDYQRTKPIVGVTYIVSGAAARTRPTDRASFTAYAASVLHYLDIAIWGDRIEVTAYSAAGPFDHFTLNDTIPAGPNG